MNTQPSTKRPTTQTQGVRPITLIAPVKGEAVDGDAVPFSWKPVPGAQAYWLQVAADEDFTDLRFNARVEEPPTTLFHLFSNDDARYWWRVRYLPAEGAWRAFSERASFFAVSARALVEETETPAPVSPVGQMPVDAAAVPFRWTLARGADDYRLQVAADEAFNDLIFDLALGPCTSMTLYQLLPDSGTLHFWRVQGRVGGSWQAGSAVATFRPVRDEVAEAFAIKQEAARAEADREAARQALAEAAGQAEDSAPFHEGKTSRLQVLIMIYVMLISFLISLYIIVAVIEPL